MTLAALAAKTDFTLRTGDGERIVDSLYAGDLPSWVLAHAPSGALWFTVICNLNVLAIAERNRLAGIVLAEDIPVSAEFLEQAGQHRIPVLTTSLPVAEAVCAARAVFSDSNT